MPGFTEEDIIELFDYHPPQSDAQIRRYETLRAAGRSFAQAILHYTPSSAEQTLAIRAAHQAVMHAITAIALSDPLAPPA